MLRRTLLAGLILAPMILTACEDKDASGPQGTNGVVTVNAYVDADGSGTPNVGDTFLSGRAVTLTSGGQVLTATTDANGVATFAAVPPGSYTVSSTGSALPTGAVLASASSPSVVVPFKGGTMSTEFRYVYNPGSISGQLFRDNNANGSFDTGDTPAPGMTVSLFAGTDTTKAPVATTTTDATGVFTFTTIRPGSYTVKVSAIPTITIVGGATQTVTVGANAATAFPVKFTGNLIGTIAEARAAAVNATVAFEGIATVAQGTFASPAAPTTTQQLYVQDANAGILVFNTGTATSIVAGDSVRVVGIRTSNGTEVQVGTTAAPPVVTKLGTSTVPAARVVALAPVLAGQFQGQLLTMTDLLVRNLGAVSGTTGSYNVNVQQGTNPADTFQVRIPSSNTGIPASTFTAGQRYDVTGDMGIFGAQPNLKPRSLADVKLRSSAISIDSARSLRPAIDTVMVEGVVYVGTGNFNLASVYIMDKTGGINVFNVPTGTTLVQGDSIRVRGLLTLFSGELEVARFSATSPPVIEILGKGTIPQPTLINYNALASKDFDGSLVKLLGLKVVSRGAITASTGSYNVNVTAPGGQAMVIRVDNRATGIDSSMWTPGLIVDVAGAAVNFTTGTPAVTTPQIKPRAPSDITITTTQAPARTIADIRTLFNGHLSDSPAFSVDSATVDGVVIAGRGTFGTGSIYIYDGTAAIQVFGVPTTQTLVPGDFVRVHGHIVIFGGGKELEFTNTGLPAGDVFSVTKLGQGPIVSETVLTGAQLVAHSHEGQLVEVDNITVTSITAQATPGVSSYTVNATAADGTAIIIFMSAPSGAVPAPATLFVVGGKYDVRGIEVPFLPTGTTTIVGELKPRGATDVRVHQ